MPDQILYGNIVLEMHIAEAGTVLMEVELAIQKMKFVACADQMPRRHGDVSAARFLCKGSEVCFEAMSHHIMNIRNPQ